MSSIRKLFINQYIGSDCSQYTEGFWGIEYCCFLWLSPLEKPKHTKFISLLHVFFAVWIWMFRFDLNAWAWDSCQVSANMRNQWFRFFILIVLSTIQNQEYPVDYVYTPCELSHIAVQIYATQIIISMSSTAIYARHCPNWANSVGFTQNSLIVTKFGWEIHTLREHKCFTFTAANTINRLM